LKITSVGVNVRSFLTVQTPTYLKGKIVDSNSDGVGA
jgi:hypothetical protein